MSSREDEALAGREIPNDDTIQLGVREALAWDNRLRDTHISVRVVNSVVTLTGQVATERQRVIAGELAEGVWGVGRVVNRLRLARRQAA